MKDYGVYTDERLDEMYAMNEARAMHYHEEMIRICNERMRRAKAAQPEFKMTPTFSLEEIEQAQYMLEKSK